MSKLSSKIPLIPNRPNQPKAQLQLSRRVLYHVYTSFRWLKRFRLCLVMLLLILMCGCQSGMVVYLDTFDSTALGEPPGPPQIGTSIVIGDVRIAQNPINDISPDRWLQLKRTAPFELATYEGTLEETVTAETGTVTLVGYIPNFAPSTMSVYFDPPDLAPDGVQLLHIDLRDNGNILLNDSEVLGTYEFDTLVAFLVRFDLADTPPTATLVVRGGGDDANATVEIPSPVASFGLGKIRLETPLAENPGLFLVDDVITGRGPIEEPEVPEVPPCPSSDECIVCNIPNMETGNIYGPILITPTSCSAVTNLPAPPYTPYVLLQRQNASQFQVDASPNINILSGPEDDVSVDYGSYVNTFTIEGISGTFEFSYTTSSLETNMIVSDAELKFNEMGE